MGAGLLPLPGVWTFSSFKKSPLPLCEGVRGWGNVRSICLNQPFCKLPDLRQRQGPNDGLADAFRKHEKDFATFAFFIL